MSRTVLLLAATPAGLDRVPEEVEARRADGDRVVLAAYRVPDRLAALLDDHRALREAAQGNGPAFRRELRGAKPAERFWAHLREDPWVAEGEADVFVPLDKPSMPAAMRLGEDDPGPDPDTPRPSHRVTHARAKALSLLAEGHSERAARAARAAAHKARNPRVAADVLGDVASRALADGVPTGLARDAYAAELGLADAHLEAGLAREAAESVEEALGTAFHRTLHFHGLASPLAAEPAGFTEPLHGSTAMRRLRARTGRTRPVAAVGDRPIRLLIVNRGTQAFIGTIHDHFAGLPDFEVRFETLPDLGPLAPYVNAPAAYVEQVLAARPELAAGAEELLRPMLDWADVVLVDWCTGPAALLTRIDPGETRVIVRLHSYETFTPWPQLVDFSRVDDVVFVGEHLRDLTLAAVPGFAEAVGRGDTRVTVLPNAMDLRPMVRPKPPEARFVLGVLGMAKIVKDPRWALDVLRVLREKDDRYRMRMIGGPFKDLSPAIHPYAEALAADLAELGDAVEMIDFTDDVPGAVADIGVILSSSVRESFHVGLVEGAASGAVPVIRDWPFFPGAAARLYPADWVVATPEEAAARIHEVTATENTWRAHGEAASTYCLQRWDWPAVQADYEKFLRG